MVLVAISEIVAWRKRELGETGFKIAFAHHYQLLRLVEAHWLEQDRVHHGEDGAVRSDTEAESENGDERETGIARQGTKRVAKIVAVHREPPLFDAAGK